MSAPPLEDRDETLSGFLTELLLIGPAALLAASLLGYGLAAAALRPVEAMRAEAAAISGSEPGRRLPLPESRDEVRRLGETLNAMLGRLEAALERERAFVADASHELRTPLALLKAELELALRRPRSPEELEQALRSAAGETDRLVRLAEDLLVLARSDQGRLALHTEQVRAERPPRRRRRPLRRGGGGRRVRRRGARRRPGSARAGSREPGRQRLAARRRTGSAQRDGAQRRRRATRPRRGARVPARVPPHAFERFSRPDEARSGHGAGLGLALAQAIAVAHGGSAGAANRERPRSRCLALDPGYAGRSGSPGSPR